MDFVLDKKAIHKTAEPAEALPSGSALNAGEALPMRPADFDTMVEALNYAAKSEHGFNFYNVRGQKEFELSYYDLQKQSIVLAKKLISFGLKRGDRVGIVADMHPDFVRVFFACQYAGLLAVPLPVVTGLGGRHGYEEQLRRILEHSGARMAIGPELLLEHLREAAKGLALDLITTADDLQNIACQDPVIEPFQKGEASHIQFSSGSTRYPSGILITQEALLANAHSVGTDALNFTANERVASWLPFYHDMGLVGCMLMAVTYQFPVDYIHTDAFARRPLQWLQLISDNKCTIAFSPSFGYEICARRAAGKEDLGLDLSSWRIAGIGGEMVQPEALEAFSKAFGPYGFQKEAFIPSYGLAEATLAFSFNPLDRGLKIDYVDKQALVKEGLARSVAQDQVISLNPHSLQNVGMPVTSTIDVRGFASCGRVLSGYDVEIRSAEGEALPHRHVGKVFIKGPSLMAGYYKDEDATNRVFDGEGWMDTGDMGYMADGELYITGREKDLIIINGRNIWPQDLEWHAENNVDVLRSRDTAAFTLQHDSGKEEAVILVQCRIRDEEKRASLRKAVHSAIMRGTGVDCRVELIPQRSLPFTTSGKLSRAKAKKDYVSGAINPSNIS